MREPRIDTRFEVNQQANHFTGPAQPSSTYRDGIFSFKKAGSDQMRIGAELPLGGDPSVGTVTNQDRRLSFSVCKDVCSSQLLFFLR